MPVAYDEAAAVSGAASVVHIINGPPACLARPAEQPRPHHARSSLGAFGMPPQRRQAHRPPPSLPARRRQLPPAGSVVRAAPSVRTPTGAHRRPVATSPACTTSCWQPGSGSQGRYPAPHGCPNPADHGDPWTPPGSAKRSSEAVYSPQPDVSSIPKGWRPRRSLADRLRLCSGRLTAEMQSLSGWRISL
jgi:hypothetical protein